MDQITSPSFKIVTIVFVVALIGFLIAKTMKKNSITEPITQPTIAPEQSTSSEDTTDPQQQ